MNLSRPFPLLLLGVALLAGCAGKQPPPATNPALMPTQTRLADDVHQRVRDLDRRIDSLAEQGRWLPGHGEQEYRQRMTLAFTDIAQVLVILQGGEQTGEFRQQLRIVDGARAQLGAGPAELSSEPVVASGLRAAYRALANLRSLDFSDVKALAGALDQLRGTIDELDAVHGPMQRVVASQAVGQTALVTRQMAAALADRIGDSAATRPAMPGMPEAPATPMTPAPPTTTAAPATPVAPEAPAPAAPTAPAAPEARAPAAPAPATPVAPETSAPAAPPQPDPAGAK